jgi:Na+-translocating ferredoxin:NAD+ oxidoreductase RnfC subunit
MKVNPVRSGRQVPTKMLTRKLGLTKFDTPAPYAEVDFKPVKVTIPLKQHSGSPASAIVAIGKSITKGELIGKMPDGVLGANVHSSIDGVVESIGSSITIRKA